MAVSQEVNISTTPSEITFTLKTATGAGNTYPSSTNWTGSGNYGIQVVRYAASQTNITDPSAGSNNAWTYTNGDPNKNNEKSYNFTQALTTIDISKFAVTFPSSWMS
ncbi:MAG: hypothetical protein LBT39_10330 [Treponema sp.]|nr:hypothetical protein [Treponema sp.]